MYNPFERLRGASGRIHWIWYIVYVLLLIFVVWLSLLIMLRAAIIKRESWLYDKTTWIPGLGADSWARKTDENSNL